MWLFYICIDFSKRFLHEKIKKLMFGRLVTGIAVDLERGVAWSRRESQQATERSGARHAAVAPANCSQQTSPVRCNVQ